MSMVLQSVRPNQARSGISVAKEHVNEPLRECVRIALERYFEHIDGHGVDGIYQMVMTEVEPPMLETVLRHCGGNQTRAADMLGMSRSTLRKKLALYRLNP
jgi:Fis family transcriptional regulator